jgi:hypothetical protein
MYNIGFRPSLSHCQQRGYVIKIPRVPLATEPGISLIILTPMKILQRNLNSTRYDVTFLTESGKSASNFVTIFLISDKIITEMPGSVASRTPDILRMEK